MECGLILLGAQLFILISQAAAAKALSGGPIQAPPPFSVAGLGRQTLQDTVLLPALATLTAGPAPRRKEKCLPHFTHFQYSDTWPLPNSAQDCTHRAGVG